MSINTTHIIITSITVIFLLVINHSDSSTIEILNWIANWIMAVSAFYALATWKQQHRFGEIQKIRELNNRCISLNSDLNLFATNVAKMVSSSSSYEQKYKVANRNFDEWNDKKKLLESAVSELMGFHNTSVKHFVEIQCHLDEIKDVKFPSKAYEEIASESHEVKGTTIVLFSYNSIFEELLPDETLLMNHCNNLGKAFNDLTSVLDREQTRLF